MASQKRDIDIVIGLSAVVIAVTAGEPRVLTVDQPGAPPAGRKREKRVVEGLTA